MKMAIVVAAVIAMMCVSVPWLTPQKTQIHNNLVQAATNVGSFNTSLKAVSAAGLTDMLSKDGPYTVFAPTDEVFSKIPQGTIDAALNDKPKLTKIINNHIVKGRYTTKKLAKMKSVTTLNGETLPIKTVGGTIIVGGVKLVKPNIVANNGVIHGIDGMLMPK